MASLKQIATEIAHEYNRWDDVIFIERIKALLLNKNTIISLLDIFLSM